jgi:hypothetical protein
MQKKQISTKTSLTFLILLMPLLFAGCMKDNNANSEFLFFDFQATREPIYDPEDNCQKTYFSFSGGNLAQLIDSFTITIDGEKMGFDLAGFYYFEKCGRYDDGDVVKVKINHSRWGNIEFDYLFPDKPDTTYFRPEIADWVTRVNDNNANNDSITALYSPTTYCNTFLGSLFLDTSYPNDTIYSIATSMKNKLFYENSSGNQSWSKIKTEYINGTDLIMVNIFGWEDYINWDNYCQIRAYCITKQWDYISHTSNSLSRRTGTLTIGSQLKHMQ